MDERQCQIQALAARMRLVEERWRRDGGDAQSPGDVSAAVGSLRRRRLHEWCGVAGLDVARWGPPVAALGDAAGAAGRDSGRLIVWIGRAVWPYPVAIAAPWWRSSVLVDPPNDDARLWAIDLALRSDGVTAVVADGACMSLRATRRLQLAAEAGHALALLARPPDETTRRSAAAYRWRVTAAPATNGRPRWVVDLIRSKDAASVSWTAGARQTVLEWHHGQGLVAVSALVADREASSQPRSA